MRAFAACLLAGVLAGFAPGSSWAQEEFPGSITIPGSGVAIKIGGYAKLDLIHDFDAIGNEYQFATNSIPTGGADADLGARSTIHARESRLTLEVRADAGIRIYLEGDFFGGSGNSFRLRQAYGEYAGLLAGQTWSTFQDISSRQLTLDYEGPDGEIFVRQALLRWTQKFSESAHWAIALEDPTPQFDVPAGETGEVRAGVPDLATNVRLMGSRGHVQLSGLLRQLRFDGQDTSPDASTVGWGINGAFLFHAVGADEVRGQAVYGNGIGRYIESFGGQNVDAVFGSNNELEGIKAFAANIGYIHHWRDDIKSGISYSIADLSPNPAQSSGSIEQTQDARLNLIVTPVTRMDVGGELLYGRRKDVSGDSGTAWRVQFSVKYLIN